MTEYETKLRDEFAKIAFEALIGKAATEGFGFDKTNAFIAVSYDFADNAMEARNAK